MIVVDTSAIVAIAFGEAERETFSRVIQQSGKSPDEHCFRRGGADGRTWAARTTRRYSGG